MWGYLGGCVGVLGDVGGYEGVSGECLGGFRGDVGDVRSYLGWAAFVPFHTLEPCTGTCHRAWGPLTPEGHVCGR